VHVAGRESKIASRLFRQDSVSNPPRFSGLHEKGHVYRNHISILQEMKFGSAMALLMMLNLYRCCGAA